MGPVQGVGSGALSADEKSAGARSADGKNRSERGALYDYCFVLLCSVCSNFSWPERGALRVKWPGEWSADEREPLKGQKLRTY